MAGRRLFRITGRGVFGIREIRIYIDLCIIESIPDVDLICGRSFSVFWFMVGTGIESCWRFGNE